MIILSTSLLTFVDLIELIETDTTMQIDYEMNEVLLNEWIKPITPKLKLSKSYENSKIQAIKNTNSKKKISLVKDSELIKEFKKGKRGKRDKTGKRNGRGERSSRGVLQI